MQLDKEHHLKGVKDHSDEKAGKPDQCENLSVEHLKFEKFEQEYDGLQNAFSFSQKQNNKCF